VYAGPGNDPALNELQSECPNLVADIPVCQSQYKKKIILSLGGGLETYGLTGAANGTAFADFIWGAFGPQTKQWLARGLPRPFDGPNNQSVEVDGFDFDIEFPSTGRCRPLIGTIIWLTKSRRQPSGIYCNDTEAPRIFSRCK
jgi:chitinase